MKHFLCTIILLVLSVNCIADDLQKNRFVKSILTKDKQSIIQQIDDRFINVIWPSFSVNDNPVLKLIDQNDFDFLCFLLENHFPKKYWDVSLGHDGEWASYPFYCLKTNNLNALKYLYGKGFRLAHESIFVEVEGERLYEDIRLAIGMNCDPKILDFLMDNETKPGKRYVFRNGSAGELTNTTILFGIDNEELFDRVVKKMKLQPIINAISSHYNPELSRKTLLDCALETEDEKLIPVVKMYGGLTMRELLLKMNNSDLSKIIYRKGFVNTDALVMREMPTRESPKVITLYEGAQIGVVSISKEETIDGISSSWYLVTNGKNAGYCFGGYLKLSDYEYDLYEEARKF